MKKPRVLVVAGLFPVPVDRGDKNRLYHSLELMKRYADVTLGYADRSWEPACGPRELSGVETVACPVSKAEVLRQCVVSVCRGRPQRLFRFASPRMLNFVRQAVARYKPDLLWFFQIPAFDLLRRAGDLPKVLDLVDSFSLHDRMRRVEARSLFPARWSAGMSRRVAYFEGRAIAACAYALVSSAPDREHLIRQHGHRERMVLFPNSVPEALLGVRRVARVSSATPHILFAGNLAYPPNAAGVRFFIGQVLPLVHARWPRAVFAVYGPHSERLAAELGDRPGVCLEGYVNDLAERYARADMMVAPLPFATGSQYKVLEGMATGLPLVMSPASAHACGLAHEREALVASTPAAYAAAINRLIEDREAADRMARRARALVAERYTWEKQAPLMETILTRALSGEAMPCTE